MVKDNVFIIEFIDRSTECIVGDRELDSMSITKVLNELGQSPENLIGGSVIEIDATDFQKIGESLLPIGINPSSILLARLRRRRKLDDLPYKIHTNRELAMMLAGSKPLAVFSEHVQDPNNEASVIPDAQFLPHVAEGLFVRREITTTAADGQKDRLVLYATRAETWRIEAYILLRHTAEKCGWSEGFERLEGSLLGYLDWQNDAYIRIIFLPHSKK